MIREENSKLSGPTGPLIVVDRCVLLQRMERLIPPNAEIVVVDAYGHESVENPKTLKFQGMNEHEVFSQWAKTHAETIWLGRFWKEMICEEANTCQLVSRERAIDLELTTDFRETAKSGEFNWNIHIKPGVSAGWREFGDALHKLSDDRKCSDPEWRKAFPDLEARIAYVRRPDQIQEAIHLYDPRFSDSVWSNFLGVFPDRMAVARMARILAWYSLKYSLGETKDFENNQEDAEYALTASYVGRLATEDPGLSDLMQAVFPECELYPPPS